jgi:hypothetical protein
MRTRQHLGKIITVLVIAAFAAPAAMAGSPASSMVRDGRSPDTIDAGLAAHTALASFDGRSPDTIDAGPQGAAVPYGRAGGLKSITQTPATVLADGRSPDTIDAAVQAHGTVVTVVRSPGFDWIDFAIGVAAALGAILLFHLSTTALGFRRNRKTSPVATA